MRLRLYWVYLKAEWQKFLEYRGDIFIFTLDGIIAPLLGLAVWLSISDATKLPLTRSELIIYFLVVFFVNTSTSAWAAYFIADEIKRGDFSKYLIRPFGMLEQNAIQNIAEKMHKLFFILLVNLVLYFILFNSHTFSPGQISIPTLILFIITLIIAAIIYFLIDIIIGLSAFWFTDVDFLRGMHSFARDFLSGKLIPIIMLPASLSSAALFSPYRYVVSFPVEVLLNKLSFDQLIIGLSVQLCWLFILIIFYKILYAKGITLYQGYGA